MTASDHKPGKTPLVVGLTGGIASGKTTVSGLLSARGAYVIDADSVGHQVIEPGGEAYPEVVAAFGTDVLEADGTIARQKLGAVVFADPGRLNQLNAISHPRMADRMRREIRTVRSRPDAERPPLIVLDAAILFEAGWDDLCDQVWTVETPPDVAIERLTASGRLTAEEARARLQAQLSNEERAAKAGQVIPNHGSLDDLAAEVERAWRELLGTA